MFELNEKLQKLEPYEPISGSYRIRLDANESFLPPDDELLSEILRAVGDVRFNRYPDPLATELCQLFAKYYDLDPKLITAGNGSDELIGVIMNAFLQKGDKVLCFEQDFSMYSFYADITEAQCIVLPKKDYRIDVDAAIKTANENHVRIIIFSNPCNPTSVGMTREDVLRFATETDALVVADEAYMDFFCQSVLDYVTDYDNLLVLKTCSKAFGMAAIRLGFAVANEVLTNALKCVKSPYNVNSVTQAIGCAVLSHPDILNRYTQIVSSSRDMLLEGLIKLTETYSDRISIIAFTANFVSLKTDEAKEIFEYLKKNGIIVRCFDGMLRLTAGRNYENKELIGSIEKYLKESVI